MYIRERRAAGDRRQRHAVHALQSDVELGHLSKTVSKRAGNRSRKYNHEYGKRTRLQKWRDNFKSSRPRAAFSSRCRKVRYALPYVPRLIKIALARGIGFSPASDYRDLTGDVIMGGDGTRINPLEIYAYRMQVVLSESWIGRIVMGVDALVDRISNGLCPFCGKHLGFWPWDCSSWLELTKVRLIEFVADYLVPLSWSARDAETAAYIRRMFVGSVLDFQDICVAQAELVIGLCCSLLREVRLVGRVISVSQDIVRVGFALSGATPPVKVSRRDIVTWIAESFRPGNFKTFLALTRFDGDNFRLPSPAWLAATMPFLATVLDTSILQATRVFLKSCLCELWPDAHQILWRGTDRIRELRFEERRELSDELYSMVLHVVIEDVSFSLSNYPRFTTSHNVRSALDMLHVWNGYFIKLGYHHLLAAFNVWHHHRGGRSFEVNYYYGGSVIHSRVLREDAANDQALASKWGVCI
jgi:hypothetical protein